jgi:putative ABC transport system permease protein
MFMVYAEHLRSAMGMVRCTQCQNVFNALATLRDESEVSGQVVTEVRNQVAYSEYGDRTMMDHRSARALLDTARHADTLPPTPARLLTATPPRLPSGEVPALTTPVAPGSVAPSELAADVAMAASAPSLMSRVLPSDLTLALRNLLRHRQRTALALGAIGFGVIALMLAGGFMEWVFWAMRESAIQGRLGHIEISRPGFLKEGAADPHAYLLPAGLPEERLIAESAGVRLLAPRVTLSGLASHGEHSVSFLADGVDPALEADLSVDFRIAAGEAMQADDPTGIIIGMGLAALLNVHPGDKLTLLANTAEGGLNGVEVTVRGVFYTSNKVWNDSALRMHIDTARSLLRIEGAHLWVLLLEDTAMTTPVMKSLSDSYAGKAGGLEFTPWFALADFYTKTVDLFSRQMNMVRAIIGLIIILSISNVLVMGVMQRTSEIGTLMAVGLRRGKVLRLFLSEGLVLGLLGAGAGVSLGYGLAELISYIGIPMPPAPGMDKGFTGEIRVTWPLALSTFLLALVTTTLASVYPAWKASRLEIVNALRHSR